MILECFGGPLMALEEEHPWMRQVIIRRSCSRLLSCVPPVSRLTLFLSQFVVLQFVLAAFSPLFQGFWVKFLLDLLDPHPASTLLIKPHHLCKYWSVSALVFPVCHKASWGHTDFLSVPSADIKIKASKMFSIDQTFVSKCENRELLIYWSQSSSNIMSSHTCTESTQCSWWTLNVSF